MITKTLKSTSHGKIKIAIPTKLHEITLGQMISIQDVFSSDEIYKDILILSILSDVKYEILKDIDNYWELDYFTDYIASISHQIKYCYNSDAIPKTVKFGTKKAKVFGLFYVEKDNIVKVISNLSIEPVGAYLASRDIIAEEINKHINLYGEENWQEFYNPDLNVMASVLAHYFYRPVTGDLYSEQKAEAFKSEVLKLSLQDALPIAKYFFFKYPDLSAPKTSLWQLLRQKLKEKQALRRLKNSRITT